MSPSASPKTHNPESIVHERYTAAARDVEPALCCPVEYAADFLKVIPDDVIERDYGCGDPTPFVRAGDTVLDLGSGAGKLCFIAAQVVGAEGRVIGVIKGVLKRLDLGDGDTPVAVFVPWRGSATFQRLDAFCKGAVDGLSDVLARGHPLVLAGEGDVGGLLGIHLREEMKIENAIISVDGLELKDFDYIDIGTMLPSSGAVPVVIKSLIFPTSAATGKEWQAAPRAIGEAAAAG